MQMLATMHGNCLLSVCTRTCCCTSIARLLLVGESDFQQVIFVLHSWANVYCFAFLGKCLCLPESVLYFHAEQVNKSGYLMVPRVSEANSNRPWGAVWTASDELVGGESGCFLRFAFLYISIQRKLLNVVGQSTKNGFIRFVVINCISKKAQWVLCIFSTL